MFEISRSYAAHTGGTKFYQTVRIQRDDGKGPAVAILHYDAIKGDPYPYIPHNGKSEVKLCRNVNEAGRIVSNKISEKMKPKNGGSYTDWDNKVINCTSVEHLTRKLAGFIDPSIVKTIVSHMGLDVDDVDLLSAVSEDAPTAVVETVTVDEPKAPNWGTW